MLYVGVDLHKHSISLCVVELADRSRKVIERKRFHCDQELEMAKYFANLGSYQLVVEATASYEWFVRLVEPTAELASDGRDALLQASHVLGGERSIGGRVGGTGRRGHGAAGPEGREGAVGRRHSKFPGN